MTTHYNGNSITVLHGDCLTELAALPDNSVDSIVTDPPYGLANTSTEKFQTALAKWVHGERDFIPDGKGFMGKAWDAFVPPPAVWDECLRVLKPGGHMAVFSGARTQDLMGLSIRLAGFEVRDTLGWIYGCLSEDTEVLINGEWVQYHKAKVGDLALCYNRENDTYEWRPIEDTHKYEYGDTAYRIRSNNTDQLVSRNHRVLVERGGTYEFEFAENLAREHEIRVPVLENVRALLDDLSVRESLPSGEEQVLQRELRNVRPSTGCGETDGGARSDRDCVCRVRDEGIQAERLVEADENSDVLTRVQREVALGEVEGARTQGSSGVVRGDESSVRGESARGGQPGLERRRHSKAGTRELQGCSVCAVPAGAYEHGTQGRVCDGAPASGGPGYRATLVADGSCASCESQSGGQSAGEPVSVRVEPGAQAVRGARYTVADLASIEPVHYEGVVWCLTVPTGAFVVRRNGKVFVTGNSGFPKSMDISKAIDKQRDDNNDWKTVGSFLKSHRVSAGYATRNSFADKILNGHSNLDSAAANLSNWENGLSFPTWERWEQLKGLLGLPDDMDAEVWRLNGRKGTPGEAWEKREVISERPAYGIGGNGILNGHSEGATAKVTAPATTEAQRWSGWGTALKPAIEPIILARKPLDGTVAANVLAHGVGGLNIDACRVPGEPIEVHARTSNITGANSMSGTSTGSTGTGEFRTNGRFPANVLLDEHAAKEMDKQSGHLQTGGPKSGGATEGITGWRSGSFDRRDAGGGASRFFPVFKYQAKAPQKERPVIEREDGTKIQHPTVKPIELMRWLIKLVTPEGGTVLEPFAGSGTTVEAAILDGFTVIGIERDADYLELIQARIDRATNAIQVEDNSQPGLFGDE